MSTAAAHSSFNVIPLLPAAATARTRFSVATMENPCYSCHLRGLCLPSGFTGSDAACLDRLMLGRRKVAAGQALYRAGDKFRYLYAVRSGTFKSSLALGGDREQVSGFHMAGELMGLDGIASGAHASSATALEDAEVCAIQYAHLNELVAQGGSFGQALAQLMSREIVREHGLMLLLGSMNAEERLADFLLNVSRRMKARGYSPTEFHLRMSRAEIGSYLGMKLETVSRTFSAFQQQGLLAVDKKHVRVLDLPRLGRVATRANTEETA